MAWYEGTMTNAAGALKSILDNYLPLNSYWHIEDSEAGTNVGVYHNYAPNLGSNFIFVLRDNQADYATIEVWEAWDSVNHVGVGQAVIADGSYTLRFRKSAGGWKLSVRDLRFIFINCGSYFGYYVGQMKRFNMSRNMPLVITHTSNAGGTNYVRNLLGAGTSSGGRWYVLFDQGGNVAEVQPTNQADLDLYFATIEGSFLISEQPVLHIGTNKIMGLLDGVFRAYNLGEGLSNGDRIYINGIPWMVVAGGGYYSIVRMD